MTEQAQFNAAYWGSKHPEVQKLSGMEAFSTARADAAFALAKAGHIICAWIDAYGSDPWTQMKLWEMYGYTWYPSLFQPPITIIPGIEIPGLAPYDAKHPPAGSVKVSAKIADYPPFNPPPKEEPAPDVPAMPLWVGPMGPGRFSVRVGDKSPAGTIYDGAEGKFVKHIVPTGFGFAAWWEQEGRQ